MNTTNDNRVTRKYLKDKMKVLSDFGIVNRDNYDVVFEELKTIQSRYQLDRTTRSWIMDRLK